MAKVEGLKEKLALPVVRRLFRAAAVVLLSIVLAVADARGRVEVAFNASMKMADRLVHDMVKRLAAGSFPSASRLPTSLTGQRDHGSCTCSGWHGSCCATWTQPTSSSIFTVPRIGVAEEVIEGRLSVVLFATGAVVVIAEGHAGIADLLPNKFGKQVSDAGMTFGYHNHSAEFKKYDGQTAFDYLFGNTDAKHVKIELDVGWVQVAQQDPVAILNKYQDRVIALHVKDVGKRERPEKTRRPAA